MERYQEIAWDCLTEQEQECLFLSISNGLSGWKTGEILGITHYKLLELKARSEKFFKLFSDYFQLYPTLIRPKAPLDSRFRDYIYGSIVKRLPKEEAIVYAGDSSWLLVPIRNPRIIKNMERLRESEDKWDKDLYALIMEFDRWNNWRILPRILQAPSAYKRRTTKKDKVYLRYLHRIPDFKIRAMVDMYWRAGKPGYRYFVAFISTTFPEGYVVVPIKKDKATVDAITKMKIYIFENRIDADEWGLMVKNFFVNTCNPRAGLNFWKRYRELTETAINYKYISNMDFTCNDLDMAYNLKKKSIYQITQERKQKNTDK